MFLRRNLSETLKRFAKFPVVVVVGPRQSGKTTLVRHTFNKHTYLNLEDPELLAFIERDPKAFLREYENEHGIILDEFQHAPKFLSYVQLEVDEKKRPGYFVLTGSQNFLMNQAITQTLAGRTGILTLLPLSINELAESNKLTPHYNDILFNGGYPRIYAENFTPSELYPSYIHSYIERDVRQIINVENLKTFQKFIQLCAGRVGQLLNIADIATNCGICYKTVERWLSVLEANYIIFFLQPHVNNFKKRITKTPKLYFYDTGLACSLLGIRTAHDIALSPFRGPLFECFIIADLYKQYYNSGLEPHLYFWRDQNGRVEIDCLIDLGIKLIPIEIKSGETINNSFFDGLGRWNELAETGQENNYVIYAGDSSQNRTAAHVIDWKSTGTLIEKIENVKINHKSIAKKLKT